MLHKHRKDGKRAPHKRTYSCCSLTSFVTCIIDLEDFCNNVFDDSLTSLHTSMMVNLYILTKPLSFMAKLLTLGKTFLFLG
jgi:hypothetical protein